MKATAAAPFEADALQLRYWPPVHAFSGLDAGLADFVTMARDEQKRFLASRRHDADLAGETLHRYLADIYSYALGYRDGACATGSDDALEIDLQRAKIALERELLDNWLRPPALPSGIETAEEAVSYLDALVTENPGVEHEFFRFLEEEASREAMETFLQCEVVRNEVVDDEVAMLVVGLQGKLKAVVAANLWDECGHGKLRQFHTFWLRRLLSATDGWERVLDYRANAQPWFSRITSNVNAMLLSRPPYSLMAYGCFLLFESWVAPHFARVLRGMDRLGMSSHHVRIYFEAHVRIDPMHSRELLDGILQQTPPLQPGELGQIVLGAHLAVAAGTTQYDRMLPYLASM